MVSPEGIGTQPDRPKSGRGILIAVAALVIAAGFAVLGALSPAEELAVETTTTTSATTTTVIEAPIDLDNFDIGQIVTGEPLDMALAAEIDGGYPLALVEQDDGFYAFVTTTSDWLASRGGLLAWHSEDGSSWRPLGMVIDDRYQVTRVIGTAGSLVAVGVSIDEGTVMMWRSDDATVWEASEVSRGTPSAHQRALPTAVGFDGTTTVVATTTGDDLQGLIEQALDGSGMDVDLSRWGWGLETGQDGSTTIVLTGPLGIEIDRIPLEDLPLTDEERQILETGFHSGPDESIMWVHDPSSGWAQTTVDGVFGIDTILRTSTGELVARGWGNNGMVTVTTDDGRVWARAEGGFDGPWLAERWGDFLVGPSDRSIPELLVSTDGESWDGAGLATHFPVAINWSTHPMAAGAGGVALVARSTSGDSIESGDPPTLHTDKGNLVALDPSQGRLTLEAAGATHSWQIYGRSGADDLLLDLERETIELLDPEAGVSFGRLTFDDLQSAEQEFYRSQYWDEEHRALVFTPDTETWVIQDLADYIGPEAVISDLMVGADRLLAVVLPQGDWYYPTAGGGFEIWTAPLP